MSEPLRVRLGGYGPPESTHSRALDRIASELRAALGDRVDVEIRYNVMDEGRPIGALLDDVEAGRTTLCYFSSSYLADRVPALGILDLPYVFASLEHAHAALDGPLGMALSQRTRQATDLVPLGYWDTGFRHLSNRTRPVRTPEDCRGLRIRLQPNRAHEAFFRGLSAEPVCNDLSEGIAKLRSGELDAQENPLTNFVTYGIHELHPFVTLTAHVYGARGVYASAAQLASWPDDARALLQYAATEAIRQQRETGADAEIDLESWLSARGTEILELDDAEHSAFRAVAKPLMVQARGEFDDDLWRLLDTG
jgi:TRAP-type C4-dicarboxylate transport system substrate-binding protein